MGRGEGRKGKFGGGKVTFVKAPEFRLGYLRGQPYAGPFYYANTFFSNKYGVCGLFTRCFGGSEANWWRPQGGNTNRIPLTHPANHRASGNCLRPVNPAPLI